MDQGHGQELMVLRLAGDVTPDQIPIHELFEIAIEIEKGLTALAKEATDGEPLPEDFLVALVSIREAGSTEVGISSPVHHLAEPAAERYSAAIRTDQVDTLPQEAKESVERLRVAATRRGIDLQITRQGKVVATIRPASEQPAATTPVKAEGGTSLFGVVEGVGGATPHIVLRIPPDQRFPCEADEDLCREVGSRLYEHIVLEGTATWDADTGQLLQFRADRLGPYEDGPADEAFEVLRRVFEESG